MCARLSEEEFSEWYNSLVEGANLSDKRYPVKGMNVWTPYGWKVMLNIDAAIRRDGGDRPRRGQLPSAHPGQ